MSVRVAQRQNAKRVRRRGHATPLLLLLLVLTTCCALLVVASGQLGLAGREFVVPAGLDPRAEKLYETPFASWRNENGADELAYRINRKVQLEGSKADAALHLGSPIQNSQLMRAEILLDQGGETLFSSGLLLPGSQIKTVRLSLPLEAGRYEATAWFYAVDPADLTDLGRVSEPVEILVLS